MKCSVCGRENPPEGLFCGGCSTKLKPDQTKHGAAPASVSASALITASAPILDLPPVGSALNSPISPPVTDAWRPPSVYAAPSTYYQPPGNPPQQAAYQTEQSESSRDYRYPQAAPTQSHTGYSPQPTPPQIASLYLTCIAGPDKGKRLAIGTQEITLGRSVQSGLLSDDADVSETHAAFSAQNGQLYFRALSPAPIFVEGGVYATGALNPGSQIRIGRSFWQVETTAAKATAAASLFDTVGERISAVAGVEKVEGFSAKDMFSSVLETRTDEDIEDYFLVGTRTTTPDIAAIDTAWPKPWVFFKAFVVSVLIYLGFYIGWNQFQNPNLLPGLMTIGAFAIPISVVIFYFEMNTPRNVSLYQVIKLMMTGGILALIGTLFIGTVLKGSASNILGALLIGVTEETGKVLALLIVVNKLKYRWTLNGLLLGGAVGAGFAGFESSGYSLVALLTTHSDATMFQTILLRGLLAPGGHVAWTALCGAALWKVKGNDRFSLAMLQDIRFLRIFGLAIVLHGIWDTPIELPFYLKEIAISAVAWYMILSFVQDGLKQVQAAQAQHRAEGINYSP